MPFTDVAQIAASAIETGLAFLTGETNVGQADGLRLLEALQGDLDALSEAKTKTIDGKPRPASDFLIVEDTDKVSTWHLPVKVNGKIDRRLMGGAKAALTVGYRGRKYEGPGKAAAIKKLKAMYKAEEMEWTTKTAEADAQAIEQPSMTEVSGSLRDTASRIEDAFHAAFSPADRWDGPYSVRDVFAGSPILGDIVIISDRKTGILQAAGYTDSDDGIEFVPRAEWKSIELVYQFKQAVAESDIAESTGGFISLMETDTQPADDNRAPLRLEFALIKPGFGNERDNRYYPADVLRRDAHVFEGVKMYTTDHKPGEKSERTEVAVVEKMPVRFLDDGTPVGVAAIFDPTFAEKTRNRATMGQLATLENSILGKGRIKRGKVGEKDANIVEAITRGVSVDWVTKAGAGGRALNLAENEEVDGMSEEERIEEKTKTEPVEIEPVKTDPVEEVFLSEADADSILAEAKLPDEAKARLREQQYRDVGALTEAVNAEAEYIKAVSGSGKPVMAPSKTTAQTTRTLAERNEAVNAVNQRWLGG